MVALLLLWWLGWFVGTWAGGSDESETSWSSEDRPGEDDRDEDDGVDRGRRGRLLWSPLEAQQPPSFLRLVLAVHGLPGEVGPLPQHGTQETSSQDMERGVGENVPELHAEADSRPLRAQQAFYPPARAARTHTSGDFVNAGDTFDRHLQAPADHPLPEGVLPLHVSGDHPQAPSDHAHPFEAQPLPALVVPERDGTEAPAVHDLPARRDSEHHPVPDPEVPAHLPVRNPGVPEVPAHHPVPGRGVPEHPDLGIPEVPVHLPEHHPVHDPVVPGVPARHPVPDPGVLEHPPVPDRGVFEGPAHLLGPDPGVPEHLPAHEPGVPGGPAHHPAPDPGVLHHPPLPDHGVPEAPVHLPASDPALHRGALLPDRLEWGDLPLATPRRPLHPAASLAEQLSDGRTLRRGQTGMSQGTVGGPTLEGSSLSHQDYGALGSPTQEVGSEVHSGALGSEMGYMFNGVWWSINNLVEWTLQREDLGWPSITELVNVAVQTFATHSGQHGILMTRDEADARIAREIRGEPPGRVRRWGEWRDGRDRWHLPSGNLRSRPLPEDEVVDPTASSSSQPLPATTRGDLVAPGVTPSLQVGASSSSSPALAPPDNGVTLASDVPDPSSTGGTGSDTAQDGTRGFYRHGEFVPRPRNAQEQRRHVGGQGAVRQARRAARMEAWRQGTWVPAWLRDYREDKKARDAERESGAGRHEEEDEGDETDLLQTLAVEPGDWEEEDVNSFMEQPGLRGDELARLTAAGVSNHRLRELEELLREYEHFVARDLGAEARWAMGRWLLQAQDGAELQDVCEAIVADRAQGRSRSAFTFPLRREPALGGAVRTQVVQWMDRMCGVMANIFEEGMLLSRHRPPLGRMRSTSPTRSRSPRRGEDTDGDDTQADDVSLMDVGRRRTRSLGGEDESEEELVVSPDGHAGPQDDVVPAGTHVEDEEDEVEEGDVDPVPAPLDDPLDDPVPGAGIGHIGLEALDDQDARFESLFEVGVRQARRALEVENAVRRAMHLESPGTARQVVRFLMVRQEQLAEISFFLQKALDQALRTCPNVESVVNMGNARQREQDIWKHVLDEDGETPAMERLSNNLRLKLGRLGGGAPEVVGLSGGDAGAGPARGPTRDRSRSPEPRPKPKPKPTVAPHLRAVVGGTPPCLLPWWERTVEEVPSGSGGARSSNNGSPTTASTSPSSTTASSSPSTTPTAGVAPVVGSAVVEASDGNPMVASSSLTSTTPSRVSSTSSTTAAGTLWAGLVSPTTTVAALSSSTVTVVVSATSASSSTSSTPSSLSTTSSFEMTSSSTTSTSWMQLDVRGPPASTASTSPSSLVCALPASSTVSSVTSTSSSLQPVEGMMAAPLVTMLTSSSISATTLGTSTTPTVTSVGG